jgi:anthranilate phosphoribosyltransferase
MLRTALETLLRREDLTKDAMEEAMDGIMDGRAPEAQVAAFLTGLRAKGETVEEIAAAAKVMRGKASAVSVPRAPLLDIVGTGGDCTGTFNISTAAAIVAASAGVAVAKHGNRSVSSRCGSADVLEALGVPFLSSPGSVAKCIDRTGFGFLFAPNFHSAMKNVAPIRKAMGVRTIFNVLGPLTNPAMPDRELMGVFSPELVTPMAEVLGSLGMKRAMVVHGHGGMDELSLSGPNRACLFDDGELIEMEITPESVGLSSAPIGFAVGGDAQVNREIVLSILKGKEGPKKDVVLLNSGAALFVAGRVESIAAGVSMAKEVMDSGLAGKKLEEIAETARSLEGAA